MAVNDGQEQIEPDDDEDGDRSDDFISPDAELTMAQVTRKLSLPAPTIRSWERRYDMPVTVRSQGGHRRYTNTQVEMLRSMRDRIANGQRAVDAAAQVKAEFNTSPGPLIEAFLVAAQELQSATIGTILDTAHQALGLDRSVDEVLLPALRQIGQRWEMGRGDVGHEHLASHATQAWLAKMMQSGPPLRPRPPIILCCGPRDHHTLGLEAIGALLRNRGWDCRMLGARTPVESLARAVHDTEASAVVLVSHLPQGHQAAVDALSTRELRHTPVFYAGGAFASRKARHGVPGRYLGDNLGEAADLITTTIGGEELGPPPAN